jgi:hypothetical protein
MRIGTYRRSILQITDVSVAEIWIDTKVVLAGQKIALIKGAASGDNV